MFNSGHCVRDARFIAALLCQHSPGDPCQLVGESRSQNVRMQALSGTSEPRPEAVLRPVGWPHQNDPGGSHEEHAQVTIAALGDAPEDSSISSRHLRGHEPDPGRKIPPSRECRAAADRCILRIGPAYPSPLSRALKLLMVASAVEKAPQKRFGTQLKPPASNSSTRTAAGPVSGYGRLRAKRASSPKALQSLDDAQQLVVAARGRHTRPSSAITQCDSNKRRATSPQRITA